MSSHESHRIARAFLASPSEGVVELSHDWRALRPPRISLEGEFGGYLVLEPLPASDFASESRYFVDGSGLGVFVLDLEEFDWIDPDSDTVYVAGAFNGWQEAVGEEQWRMSLETIEGKRALVLRVPLEAVDIARTVPFKFVTGDHHWLPVDAEAPNSVMDDLGNCNYVFAAARSGRHRFRFALEEPLDLAKNHTLIYHSRIHEHRTRLDPGPFFLQLKSDKALGAIVEGDRTVFRLFAPRAEWVKVGVFGKDEMEADLEWIDMEPSEDFVWEVSISENLDGARYWFRLDGPDGECGVFDPNFKILDPYAKAALGREGPGVVVDLERFEPLDHYPVPQWQDLVILEAHTRDLVAGLPENAELDRPLGFPDLQAYVDRPDFYPATLGINALELQPVQENDSRSYGEYHWGYMTANFFAPASQYGSDPQNASQIEEFRSLVSSIHQRGMAVILDVVYNHVGEPAHLMYIDKLYYFHVEGDGALTNWSGCGNDLRCDAPMARRIIVESLKHLVLFYGVDGFRFDLADLVGKAALQEIERELKAVKPDVILIAEPWSFRGHIGRDLIDTGYASWNDGYREGIKSYVKGELSSGQLSHLLKGSPDDYADWPSQTVNYTESHDDRVWIDVITEQPEFDGTLPALNDIRRTHMMAALLMASIGMPMLHAGQDFLFSKGGVNNTYQRGDLNALDYGRRSEFALSSDYIRGWIAFRMSETGRLLRHYSRASDGFFEFDEQEGRNALAALYNADGSRGPRKLLFAVNPETEPLRMSLGDWSGAWTQLADHDRFWGEELEPLRVDLTDELLLPPLGTGLWISAD